MKNTQNIIFNGLLKVSAILFPLLTVTYATRTLGPENYGYAVGLLAIVGFFVNLPTLPFGAFAVTKLTESTSLKAKQLSNIFLGIGFSISVLSAIFLLFVLVFFSDYKNLVLISIALLTICSSFLSLEWYYQFKGEYKRLFVRTLIIRGLALLAIFVFVTKATNYVEYASILLLMISLPNAYNLYYYLSSNGFTYKDVFPFNKLKKYLPGLIKNASVGFFISVYTLLPIALAAFVLTTKEFSYVSLADRIIRLIVSLTASFSIVLLPTQVKLFRESEALAGVYLNKVIDSTIAVCIFLIFTIILFAKYIVFILAGEKFIESSTYLIYLCPLLLLIPLNSIIIYQYFYAKNKLNALLKITCLVAVLSVLLVYLFTLLYSVNGYILSILIVETILFINLYILALGLRELVLMFVKILICSANLYLAYSLSEMINFTEYFSVLNSTILCVFIGLLLYLPVLLLLKKSHLNTALVGK